MNHAVSSAVPSGLPDPERHLRLARKKVRVATLKNEKFPLNIAHHGTAAHVEKVVSNYRHGKRLEILYEENNRHAHRELSWYMDGDGMWVFKGKFTAEQGALIARALECAMDEIFEEQRNEPSDLSAETLIQSEPTITIMGWTSRPKLFHRCGRER